MCDPEVVDRGLLLSPVGSQEAFRTVLRNQQQAGVVPELHRLSDYDGGKRTLETLTDRQLEVLQTAYEIGFTTYLGRRPLLMSPVKSVSMVEQSRNTFSGPS